MKKIYIAMAVIAAAMLSSCEKEKDFGGLTPLGKNDIAFTINNTGTRSMAAISETAAHTGVSIPAGKTSDGEDLFLEETIEELNPTLATRGTPAYTVNLGTLYKTMGVYAEDLGEAGFEVMDYYDRKVASEGKGWRYHHNYDGSPWPEDKDKVVDFYLHMPNNAANVTFTKRADKEIVFDYTSPATGEAQEDIIFGQTSISKNQHDGYLPNGAPVMMYHALSGVKFRGVNDNSGDTKTVITSVKFTNLKGSGTCTVNPSDPDNLVMWDNVAGKKSFSQSFNNPAHPGTNTVDYVKPESGDAKFGDSWYAAAADKNLNDDDGSLTFWFIPQAITSETLLEIEFYVKTSDTPDGNNNGEPIKHTIKFGEQLAAKNVVWNAGQLRTYTLKALDVDVEIFDHIEGWEKTDLHVTNTGNVKEYVRMMVIGNWYDENGNILVGYKYAGDETNLPAGTDINEMVRPWFREGYETSPGSGVYVDPYGYFDESFLLGYPKAGRTDWVRGTGSYFYYTSPIGPGVELDSATQALFQSYTVTSVPTIYVPTKGSNVRVPAKGVHLRMEIVVQAIGAPTDDDGNVTKTCWQAWTDAVGKTIKEKPKK